MWFPRTSGNNSLPVLLPAAQDQTAQESCVPVLARPGAAASPGNATKFGYTLSVENHVWERTGNIGVMNVKRSGRVRSLDGQAGASVNHSHSL